MAFNNKQAMLSQPRLEIIEQPKSRGYRFRYECEGSSHGNITGESSSKGNRTFPTVKLVNWAGAARISVECVTDEDKPKPHTHELIGKMCKNGICVTELTPGDKGIKKFDGLSIKHSTRKRAIEILTLRNEEAILQGKMQSNIRQGKLRDTVKLSEDEKKQAVENAKKTCPDLDLSVVRLLFKAHLLNSSQQVERIVEVVSQPIYDAKSPGAAALRICRMDKSSGSCVGDEEIFLLCDKVQKDDISVSFEEIGEDGLVKWEGYGKFGPQDVHRQFAIVFRTPPFRSTQIMSPVEVKVKLKRLSKPEESNGVSFTYHPELEDENQINLKKRKKLNQMLENQTIHTPSSNGIVKRSGMDNMKRNTMETICDQSPVATHVPFSGHQPAATIFPMNTCLPSMFEPNIQQVIPSPEAASSASSFLSSPKDSPSPSSFYDQRFEPCSPLEYEVSMYDQVTCYQGRGLSDPKCKPTVSPMSCHQQEIQVWNKTDQILDLSGPKPLDLRRSKLQVDAANSYDSVSNCYMDRILDNANVPVKKQVSDVIIPKKSDVESQLTKEVIQFGDRLFRALQTYAQSANVDCLLMVLRHLLVEQDENGDSLLHMAVTHYKLDTLRRFLNVARTLPQYDIVNRKNHLHQTPLHIASIMRNAVAVEALIEHNASVSMIDYCGNTPIHLAVTHKAPCCLKVMLNHLLKKHGDKPPEVDVLNYKGYAPLHLAVQARHMECVKTLINKGRANVNIEDGCSGKTPLHYAVENDHLAVVGFLINQPKIDVNAPDFRGITPLHIAVQMRLQGCTALLMAAGADPDAEIIEHVADSDDDESSCTDVSKDELSQKERIMQKSDEKQPDDEQNQNDEEDKVPSGVKISTAWSLAEGSELMENILQGKEHEETGNTLIGITIADDTQNMIPRSSTNLYTVPPAEKASDMNELDSMVRTQLAHLLDPVQDKKDWKALAEKLDMSLPVIEAIGYMSSPTKALLDNFEATAGTIDKLQDALHMMERLDAVKLIENVRKEKKIARRVYLKAVLPPFAAHVETVESGIGSLTL